jgi:lipopolysaccharide/colanic/teichoic acid biosynthesis glycosyltransferase
VTLRAWPFFVQRRIGRGGRAFSIVKIRTLPRHVPAYMLKTELGQVRLPALSRFLRAHHLDELPQLFLVPLGTLSLVGPRPKMPDAAEPVDEHYGRMRVQVPQGCTGLWQISPHKGELPHEAPMYDRFYVQHSSLALDLWILAKTMLVMTRLSAPVALDGMPAWVVRRAGVPLYAGRAGQPRRPSRREGEFPQLAFGSSRLES